MSRVNSLVSADISNYLTNKETWGGIIYNVKSYGAKGDGVTDDTAEIQAAVNAAMITGGEIIFPGKGPYLISSEIVIKPLIVQATAGAGALVHFSDTIKVRIHSDSRSIIKASSAMTNMFHVVYNPDIVNGVGPFYSEIYGLLLDGNNLASNGIYIDYTMHVKVENNAIFNLNTGITIGAAVGHGYGVSEIIYNVIRAPQCILVQAGDNYIEHNDFYPFGTNGCGVYMSWYSGNTTLLHNVFSRDVANDPSSILYAIKLMGSDSPTGAQEIRDIDIAFNEFDGMHYGVFATAHTTTKNIYGCHIFSNHVKGDGINNCMLAYLYYCKDIIITDNRAGAKDYPDELQFVQLNNCDRIEISYNEIINNTGNTIDMSVCTDCNIESNHAFDVGKSSPGNGFISMNGACTGNVIKRNRVKQSSSAYAQNGVVEGTGGNDNLADYNQFENMSSEYFKSGANSILKSRLYGSAAPTVGTWLQGAILENISPSASGNLGWVCVTGGTPGTWKTFGTIQA